MLHEDKFKVGIVIFEESVQGDMIDRTLSDFGLYFIIQLILHQSNCIE